MLSVVCFVSVTSEHGESQCICTLSLSHHERRGETWQLTDPRHIASKRNPIPDVPVLYLVEPTPKNLKAITDDLSRQLYSPAYINFLSSIPRPLLEEFAAQTAEAGTSENIAQVYDQYLNFIVSEPDLFSLGMRKEHVYQSLNSASTPDAVTEGIIERTVSGLFSVVVTMGMFTKLPISNPHYPEP